MKLSWGNPKFSGGQATRKSFSTKGFTYLVMIAALGLLLGASLKWHG
jgi:hypothetical protein